MSDDGVVPAPREGTKLQGEGEKGMGWDGTGWDGTGRDGMGANPEPAARWSLVPAAGPRFTAGKGKGVPGPRRPAGSPREDTGKAAAPLPGRVRDNGAPGAAPAGRGGQTRCRGAPLLLPTPGARPGIPWGAGGGDQCPWCPVLRSPCPMPGPGAGVPRGRCPPQRCSRCRVPDAGAPGVGSGHC